MIEAPEYEKMLAVADESHQSMTTEEVLADLADRIDGGIAELHGMADGSPDDVLVRRLYDKANGMAVARDYLRAY